MTVGVFLHTERKDFCLNESGLGEAYFAFLKWENDLTSNLKSVNQRFDARHTHHGVSDFVSCISAWRSFHKNRELIKNYATRLQVEIIGWKNKINWKIRKFNLKKKKINFNNVPKLGSVEIIENFRRKLEKEIESIRLLSFERLDRRNKATRQAIDVFEWIVTDRFKFIFK